MSVSLLTPACDLYMCVCVCVCVCVWVGGWVCVGVCTCVCVKGFTYSENKLHYR